MPSWMDSLPNLNAQQGRAVPKGVPTVVAKKAKRQSKDDQAAAFRAAVWERDKGMSRATGRKLAKSGTTDGDRLGEVDHAIPRSLAPERLYDVSNGLLLSKNENRLRKAVCPQAPEHKYFDYTGPDDRGKPQRFTWRDGDGRVTKTRIG